MESILLQANPKIEFQLHDNGFDVIDAQTPSNTGFYAYDEVQTIDLNKPWFPRLAILLRVISWIFNGVPLFPDAKAYKKANLIIQSKKSKIGIWLTDIHMSKSARSLKALLDQRTN